MASVDTLPFAQPAARPEPVVAASKPAPSSSDSAEPSFADVLDTEVDAVSDTDIAAEAAPADPAAIPAQPAPPPAAQPVNTTAAVFAAMLLAPVVAQAEGEAPAIEPTISTAAAIAPAADTSADPAIATAAPVEQPAPKVDTSAPAPASPAPAAPAAPTSEATTEAVVTQTTAPAVTVAATATTKVAQPEKPADAGQDADAAAPEAKPAASADATTPAATETDAAPAPAPTQPVTTPAPAIPGNVGLFTAADLKPVPPELSQHAPGARRTSATTEIDAPADANADTSKKGAGAQSAASGAAPAAASASTNKPTAQAAAATAAGADAAPDIKADAAAPSTAASASFADTLAAARGQAPDAARAQANPHLQSAPAAALQVYTRFVERFDGRAQRFEVRLDPAELGRVDVRIEIGADKKVHAVLAAHDSAAMSDLMRGQRALERALSDAGIDLAEGGLRFELSSDTGRNLAGGQQRGDSWSNDELAHAWRGFSSVDVGVDAAPADVAAATRSYFRGASRLDLVA